MAENKGETRETIIYNALGAAHGSVEYVLGAIMGFQGAKGFSFVHALKAAETAYLETYMAWQVEKNDKAQYKEAHVQAASIREKMLAMKKLMEELECEGDQLLQFVHSLRT